MSDNVTNLNEKQKKWPVRRIILFAVLVLVVCLGVAAYVFRDSLNLDAARRFVRYLNVSGGGTDGQFLFDAGNANQYADFDGGLAVAGATGISTYEADGSEFTVVQEKLTTPAIAHAGKQVMAYDVGGYALHVIRAGKGSVLDVTAERPILDADLAEDGSACYSTSESGYKSVSLRLQWQSGAHLPPPLRQPVSAHLRGEQRCGLCGRGGARSVGRCV